MVKFGLYGIDSIGTVDVDNIHINPTGGGPQPTPTSSSSPTPGQSTILLWTVTNATSCTASGSWSGSKDPNGGTMQVTPGQSSTYILTCTGPGGKGQGSATATVGASSSCI